MVASVHVPGQWTWEGASGNAISGITAGYPATLARPQTRFRTGSITKVFAAAGILLLEEEGLISLQDDVSLYLRPTLLNDTIKNSAPLTIIHLLNHTSGILNSADNTDCLQDALSDLTRYFPLEEAIYCGAVQGEYFPPGFAWSYSNTNYSILAMIIEQVSGLDFKTFIENRIIQPLGLNETEIPVNDEISGDHMGCYWNVGQWIDLTIVDPSLYNGWASVVSTASDLTKFFRSLREGALISPASWQKMMTIYPGSWDYGLGLEF